MSTPIIIIRHKPTGYFYHGNGWWVSDAGHAEVFGPIHRNHLQALIDNFGDEIVLLETTYEAHSAITRNRRAVGDYRSAADFDPFYYTAQPGVAIRRFINGPDRPAVNVSKWW